MNDSFVSHHLFSSPFSSPVSPPFPLSFLSLQVFEFLAMAAYWFLDQCGVISEALGGWALSASGGLTLPDVPPPAIAHLPTHFAEDIVYVGER